jgi:type I restriction-modification system DNA methylase subunit
MPRPKKSAATAEYRHVVLGLMFLKYISDSFEEMHSALHEGKGSHAGSDSEEADVSGEGQAVSPSTVLPNIGRFAKPNRGLMGEAC